jgi:RNA polymerase sigma-70 factor (ECF subfamily)
VESTQLSEFSQLLAGCGSGDPEAEQSLLPLIQSTLRTLAASHLRRERSGDEVRMKPLIAEAYWRLSGHSFSDAPDRAIFLYVSARALRRILVDHTRKRRPRGRPRSGADSGKLHKASSSLLAIHLLLAQFAEIDPHRAGIVELRYFGGLDPEEVAEVVGDSPANVERDYQVARRWLYKNLNR